VGFWRDSRGLLIFDAQGVAAKDYPALCRRIADAFGLAPAGDLIVGPDQMFWDFRRGELVVGFDWDNWMEFMAVARSAAAEPLLRDIAEWLGSSGQVAGRAPDAEPGAAPNSAPLDLQGTIRDVSREPLEK
jgi:hypothetical protein